MVTHYFFANLLDDIGILSSFHFTSCGKMGNRLTSVYLEPTLRFLTHGDPYKQLDDFYMPGLV